jgi:hypothetical protein
MTPSDFAEKKKTPMQRVGMSHPDSATHTTLEQNLFDES